MAQSALKVAADLSVDAGEVSLRVALRASGVIEAIIDFLDSGELERGEQQVVDELRSSIDPPKTLEQLQQPPIENRLGYQRHHGVEQNPANVAKLPADCGSSAARRSTIRAICFGFLPTSMN